MAPDDEKAASEAIEQVLLDAEADGLTVSWSDCAGCGQPREAHGPGLLCPKS